MASLPTTVSHRPSPQQQAIADSFREGNDLVLYGRAGTAKTTTLVLIADVMVEQGRRGHYITLNNDVARDVGSRFTQGNVTCSTFHALAREVVSRTSLAYLLGKVDAPVEVSRFSRPRHLGITETMTYTSRRSAELQSQGLFGNMTTLTPVDFCDAAIEAVRAWCISAEDTLDERHVPDRPQMSPDFYTNEFAPRVIRHANTVWDDLLSPGGVVPFTHDHYVKLAQLAHPDLSLLFGPGSVLFFDEAQDSRPAVTDILHRQSGMQTVVVGDPCQAIYRFTGARDSLPAFMSRPGAVTLPLTVSWRFGQQIADAANIVLSLLGEEGFALEGNPALTSQVVTYRDNEVPESDAVLTRTNARLVEESLAEKARGRSVHILADTSRIMRIAEDLTRIDLGEQPRSREFTGITCPEDVEALLHGTGGNSSLRATIRLLREHGIIAVTEAIAQSTGEETSDTVCTTIHKSKGRQWPVVRIAADPDELIPSNFDSDEGRDALMLLYVAITRAQGTLYIPEALAAAITSALPAGGVSPGR